MKNRIFARVARAYFIFLHFEDVLVLSTTWNDLFCSCVDEVSIWCQMLVFIFLCPKRWFQFNSRIVRTHFSSIRTLNNWKMIAEPRSYISRRHSRFRRRRISLSSLISGHQQPKVLHSALISYPFYYLFLPVHSENIHLCMLFRHFLFTRRIFTSPKRDIFITMTFPSV